MSENYVADHVTPCSVPDLYAALERAWGECCPDSAPTRESLTVLIGHWALETGWGHFCHAHNLGNAKYTRGCGHDYTLFPCSEVLGGIEVHFTPPDPQCRFLAFDTLDDGAHYYLTHLRAEFRCAWPAVLAGDPAQFAHLLKAARYYTADEGRYTRALVDCCDQVAKQLPVDPVADTLPPTPYPAAGSAPDEPHE